MSEDIVDEMTGLKALLGASSYLHKTYNHPVNGWLSYDTLQAYRILEELGNILHAEIRLAGTLYDLGSSGCEI